MRRCPNEINKPNIKISSLKMGQDEKRSTYKKADQGERRAINQFE
jgi:hypothetical protein